MAGPQSLVLSTFLLLLITSTVHSQANTPPLLDVGLYVYQVDENLSPGSDLDPTRPVTAIDLDGDDIQYSVDPTGLNGNLFDVRVVNTSTGNVGVVFVRNETSVILDRETSSIPLTLFVEVTDGINTPIEAEVRIYLNDLNDSPPVFSNLPSSVTFAEDTNLGSELFDVEATDLDFGPNRQILYSIVGGSVMFGIDIDTGAITLSQTFNYDVPGGTMHVLSIRAEDRGSPPLVALNSLTIYVEDINDLPPVFDPVSYELGIHENLTFGSTVLSVNANDGDTGVGDVVIYSIMSGNPEINGTVVFAINNITGLIYVNVPMLDRETHQDYTLTVLATELNDTTKIQTATVSLTILDINDNSPQFLDSSYIGNISETAGVGALVLTVTAEDPDHGIHGDFIFHLEDTDNSSSPIPFTVDFVVGVGEGRVVVNESLDFETKRRYNLRVVATEVIDNQPQNGSALVTINLNNENDNNPMFVNDTYTASIPENINNGSFVRMVMANDGDDGTFGDIAYSLTSGHLDMFTIDETTGAVSTSERIDYEENPIFTISIQAEDLAEDPSDQRMDTTTLTVTIINLNDNPPRFVDDSGMDVDQLEMNITEERDAGFRVITLDVIDADGDLNTPTYDFDSGNSFGHFGFDMNDPNVIVTAAILNRDVANISFRQYTLTVTVNDTTHADIVTVFINLVDINDNDPIFGNTSYTFEIRENVNVSTLVGQVEAEDRDSDLFGTVRYRLEGVGAESFSINNETGQIFTAAELDRESVERYDLVVTATDLDPIESERREMSVPLVIIVLDENDNSPAFVETVYLYDVVENSNIVSLTVTATDMDSGDNQIIEYAIVSGNTNNIFAIVDPLVGVISRNASQQIDREEVDSYNITVIARDNGNPSRYTTVQVLIDILDQNDVNPLFPETQYSAAIAENVSPDTIVTQLVAVDTDEGSNGRPIYSITSITPTGNSFMIDSASGTVTTLGTFDREDFPGPYTIQVLVEDGGISPNNGTTTLVISLNDVNDNPPEFGQSSYGPAFIDEGLPEDQYVLTVTATDDDEPQTPNSEVYFSISEVIITNGLITTFPGGTPVVYHFSINATSGDVFTNVTMDYESIVSYRLVIIATDMGPPPSLSRTVFATVFVNDINDNSPMFTMDTYLFNISEDSSMNTHFIIPDIEAADLDSGFNAQIQYTANATGLPFTVDETSGNLILTGTLNHEDTPRYEFPVTARDNRGMVPYRSDNATVIVTILDVNDHAPMFVEPSISVTVPEGNYTGSPVYVVNVTATDEDSNGFGDIEYSITSGDVMGVFSVDRDNGRLWVIGYIDREMVDMFSFVVTAEDGGNPPRRDTAQVTVYIMDVNDNRPMFSQTSYEGSVQENLPVNTTATIIRVSATDEDQGNNRVVTYHLAPGNTDFDIDITSGLITTTTQFNYEILDRITFNVTARDNASVNPMETTVSVAVNIIDVNDHAPIFRTLPSPVTIPEDISTSPYFTVTCCVIADDMDSGSNAEIQYQLSNDGGKFSLTANGTLILTEELDYETTTMYNITITATDQGQPPMSAVVIYRVTVADVNDDVPQFSQDAYSFLVNEDVATGSSVAMVTAVDRDSGAGGEVQFTIMEGDTTRFSIVGEEQSDGVTWRGNITISQEFNFEQDTSYFLRIQARDSSSPVNTAITNITIIVQDTNDNLPEFTLPVYSLQVAEDTIVESPIGTVGATDADSGLAGTLRYKFANGQDSIDTNTFRVDSVTGVIFLIVTIDFETTMEYTFVVEASDISSAPLTASVDVIVTVQDMNEFAPIFHGTPYVATVEEERPALFTVFTVNATEGDGNGDLISYRIAAGDTTKFDISGNGVIMTKEALDRESASRYILTIEASDMGSVQLSSYVQVDITVTDINDNKPTFGVTSYEYTNLPENSDPGTVLDPTLVATDTDEGTNGAVKYSLIGGPFEVDEDTGVITVAAGAALNRETTPVYVLSLEAMDEGDFPMSEAIMIRVVLEDVNDNSPEFTGTPYMTEVNEHSPDGFAVFTVSANDMDGDGIQYSITSGDDTEPKFTINPNTGFIETTNNELNREVKDTYELTVVATDDGNPQRPTEVTVTVTVTDINDNVPDFDADPYEFPIDEANDIQVFIAKLTATDNDEGTNADVTFRFAPGSNLDGIFLLEDNGELYAVADQLDFESEDMHVLRVVAQDQANSNRMSSTATVTIILEDVNDNDPEFDESVYNAQVFEDASFGDTILVVMASDIDTGENAKITYNFQTPISVFSIDPVEGSITVSGDLDSETIPSYTMVVEARDNGSPTQRVGMATVIIDVLNINDNNPRFDRSFYTESLSEGVPPDTQVITVSATDPDGSDVTYHIVSGNVDRYFKIDRDTGAISTADTLDREAVSLFTLGVVASDDGMPPQNGTTAVQITILDINDEPPEFLEVEYFASVSENSPQGTQILPEKDNITIRIEAQDADEPNTQNSRVLYSLEGPDSDLFNIDFDTGIVTVARGSELDREDRDLITVTVVAQDSVPAPGTLSTFVLLHITILDENDVPPIFTQPNGYAIAVSENTTMGSVITNNVHADDPDTGDGGSVQYSISSTTPLDVRSDFSINEDTGIITLAGTLDRETNTVITLRVVANDEGIPALSSVVIVQVSVTDVNDNPPEFQEDIYTTTVSELLPVGASAFEVEANDPDISFNAAVLYSVVDSDGPFTINTDNGVITTTSMLDHETNDSYTIIVEACDHGVPVMCARTTVIMNIEDSNDETPAFDLMVYQVDIFEDYTGGTTLVQPVATDRDSGVNAEITFSLEGQDMSLFDVNSVTGQIYLLRNVSSPDFAVHTFEIVATDNGDGPLMGSADVIIRVMNSTLLPFRFSTSYFYRVALENQDIFLTTEFIPSTPIFELDPNYDANPFTLNGHFLVLKDAVDLDESVQAGNSQALDREKRDLFTVIIRATEMMTTGKRQTLATTYTSVTVQLMDANDNRPEFENSFYRFSVNEEESNATVGMVTAVDSDSGTNAVITYSIATSNPPEGINMFNISSTGGITTSQPLNREAVDRFTLSVRAEDSTGGPTTMVEVVVEDINDVTPNFTESVYNAEISENFPPGSAVTTVVAIDTDSGANGIVTYSLVSGDVGVFQLDSLTGAITTIADLDFETDKSYQLVVRASDQGSPQEMSDVTVNVQVLDFNDCPPTFITPPESLTILEDAGNGSVLYNFDVNDCDSGLNGVNGTIFSIISGNAEELFAIGAESGILRTANSLDRETRESYLLQIQAEDNEGVGVNALASVIQLTVTILDVNDHKPEFVRPTFDISVPEGEDLAQTILEVPAMDPDDSTNGEIVYSLEDDFGVFNIDSGTGDLSLSNSLDRETVNNYTVIVIARDRGTEPQASNATVYVTVEDENDNPPVIDNIQSGITCVDVSEDALDNTVIFRTNATDRDIGQNGEILFSLEDITLPFEISTQGVITKQGDLDYETQTEYTLVVRAVDQGSPRQLTGIAALCVRVLDENDNAPMFSQSSYTGEQLENTAVSTSILVAQATDIDQTGSDNALITFTIIGDNETLETFDIDSDGVISNKVELDREQHPDPYTFMVVANNSQSHNPLDATVSVTIYILDQNDETPEFVGLPYSASLKESVDVGEFILTVVAEDGDESGSPNSDLLFVLSRLDNNRFHLDQDTGDLTVQNALDYEGLDPPEYMLMVRVEDKGALSRSSETIITITVEDVNDRPPQFGQDVYSAAVSELAEINATRPFLLATIQYTDGDGPDNRASTVIKTTVRGSADQTITGPTADLFDVINDNVGMSAQVFLLGSLDHEQAALYRIELYVHNTGEPCTGLADTCPLNDTAILEVTVLDENDNRPMFEEGQYSAEVGTTSDPGTSVVTVNAIDPDFGDFGRVQYQLEGSEGRFRIDPDTGIIFTRSSLDRLDGVTIPLIVTAFDNLGRPPSNSQSVSVNLLVLNDFQRVRIIFNIDIDTILAKEEFIIETLQNASGLAIVVESVDEGINGQTNLTFHAIDPATNEIIDYYEFLDRVEETSSIDEVFSNLAECNIVRIEPAAGPPEYLDDLDVPTSVILVLCFLLTVGAGVLLFMSFRQRYAALHDARHKLLADVFYGTPPSASMIESMQQQNFELEALEMRGHHINRQNPMFVHPYDNWTGIDTSGVESIGESGSLKRDNPLYESQEIRMEMFADVSDEEDEADVDDAELLAAALQDDDAEEDATVTAI